VYPTDWVNIPPVLTSIAVQRGWAYTNHVNLIAPSLGRTVKISSSGSGIYSASNVLTYFFNYKKNQTKTIIADLPKELPKRKSTIKTKKSSESSSTKNKEPQEVYPSFKSFLPEKCIIPNPPGSKVPYLDATCKAFQPKAGTKGSVSIKNNGITCNYQFSVLSNTVRNAIFIFLAYKGPTGFVESLDLFIQGCFLMTCFPIDLSTLDPESSSSSNQQKEVLCNIGAYPGGARGVVFDQIKISAEFLNQSSLLPLPIATYRDDQLFDDSELDFNYLDTLKLTTKKELLTLGIYATELYN